MRDLEQYRFDYLQWLVRWAGQAKPPDQKQPPEPPATLQDPRRKEFRFGDT